MGQFTVWESRYSTNILFQSILPLTVKVLDMIDKTMIGCVYGA